MNLWQAAFNLLPFEWAQFTFMSNAFLALLLVSPLFAFLGCLVINKQMAFFSDAIGHAALTGIAIGVLLGLASPLWAMIFFSLFLAVLVTVMKRYSATSTDTSIGVIVSFAVALGIVLLSRNGGFARYSRFLVGDILSITHSEIAGLFLVILVFLIIWVFSFNSIFMVSINKSLALSRRISIWFTEIVFAAITATAVTVSIPWVGILVINALLILPAAAARNISHSTRAYVWSAVALSTLAGISGLITSYYCATATGATIVLFLVVFFSVSLVVKQFHSIK